MRKYNINLLTKVSQYKPPLCLTTENKLIELPTSSGMSSAMLSGMGFLGGKVRQASRHKPIGCPLRGGADGARGGGPGNSLSLRVFAIWSTEQD